MSHLTQRAVEWLKRGGDNGQQFTAGTAHAACGADSREFIIWICVEDVRALTAGKEWVRIFEGGYRKAYRVSLPTCPKCAVLLDQLLSEFKAAHSPTTQKAT